MINPEGMNGFSLTFVCFLRHNILDSMCRDAPEVIPSVFVFLSIEVPSPLEVSRKWVRLAVFIYGRCLDLLPRQKRFLKARSVSAKSHSAQCRGSKILPDFSLQRCS